MKKDIYAFFYLDNEIRRYFYVGRTKDLSRRMKEHRYHSRAGHEDKYAKIRELEANQIEYKVEIIDSVAADQYVPDAENWHVIRLTRDGHELMNMRHGSREHRKELARQVIDKKIRSVSDVRVERERKEYEASRKRQDRDEMNMTLAAFRNGVASVRESENIPVRHRELLLKVAGVWESEDMSVGAGKEWDAEAVRYHLDVERQTKFNHWVRTVVQPLLDQRDRTRHA